MPSKGALILLLSGVLATWKARAACNYDIDPERSLGVTNLGVVSNRRSLNDGPWSFATVMRRAAANTPHAGALAYDWLHQYSTARMFNGFRLTERSSGPLFAIWPLKKPTKATRDQDRVLDLNKAPLLLLAIVFRLDIISPGDFGEGRLVYGVHDPFRGPQDMTVIFEFRLQPTPNLPSREAWYRGIASLSNLPNGETHHRALQKLTDEFTYPYGGVSQLKRLRTNEQYFGQGWEMREFRYLSRDRQLKMLPVEKTPDVSLNTFDSPLVTWVNAHRAEILRGTYQLPTEFSSASSLLPDDRFAWFAENEAIDPELKQHFAEGTCNGCHGRATHTSFLHISPREKMQVSTTSSYFKERLLERARQLQDILCPG